MTAFLPPNLLALFAAREAITYLPPADKLSHEKKRLPMAGLAEYLSLFQAEHKEEVPVVKTETREEKKERRRKERLERAAYKLEQDIALWDPQAIKGTSDPYKTLFVARISYDTSESKLRREFEEYGPIRKVYLVKDSETGKSRGYAFIEFEHERDMHAAYKHADGKKIDGRRVVVDYERGRTVKGWRPRRLGGGLGGEKRRTKTGNEEEEPTSSKRERSREREREPERDRERRDRDRDRGDRRDRDRDRDRERRRSKSRSRSRDRKKDRKDDKDRKKDRKERDRSRSKDRKDKDRAKFNEDGIDGGRRRRKSSESEHEPGEYVSSKGRAAFDSDGEDRPANGKERHFDGSSQGF